MTRNVYPTGEVIDLRKARNLDIIYPNQKVHNIIAEYVQETEDGKFVLSYLEHFGEILSQKFTELNFIDGEWSKNPFHKEYEEYKFKPFDRNMSDSIISQFPNQLRFRIVINSDSKDKNEIPVELPKEEETENLGAQVVKTHDEKNVYMVLPVNEGESVIDKVNFNFDFPFAAFSLLGETDHNINMSASRDDINYDSKYTEEMYLREELPMSIRRTITEFLKNDTEGKIDVKELPILEVENGDDTINICFISCPNIALYNDVYKSDKLFVDGDIPTSNTYDNKLESSLHEEIPLSMVLINGEMKNNGVRHNKKVEVALNK